MLEAHRPMDPDDQRIYEKINSKSIIMVLNKMDLISTDSATALPEDWRFEDQVLFLKHNLNARAIGSLRNELADIERDTDRLVREMQKAIAEADTFIQSMK